MKLQFDAHNFEQVQFRVVSTLEELVSSSSLHSAPAAQHRRK